MWDSYLPGSVFTTVIWPGFGALCVVIAAEALSIPGLFWVFIKFWKYSPVGRLVATYQPETHQANSDKQESMIGKKGVVVSEMLPSGVIQIGDKQLSAICKSGSATKGEVVEIVEVKMNRYFVLPADWLDQGAERDEMPKGPELESPSGDSDSSASEQANAARVTDQEKSSEENQKASLDSPPQASRKFENFDWED